MGGLRMIFPYRAVVAPAEVFILRPVRRWISPPRPRRNPALDAIFTVDKRTGKIGYLYRDTEWYRSGVITRRLRKSVVALPATVGSNPTHSAKKVEQ